MLVAAVAGAARADATTGIEVTVPVKVTLTDRGVAFSHKLRPTTEMTLAIRVVNKSTKRRWFKMGWRKTHLLQRGGSENFYVSFASAGRTTWISRARGGKTFAGSFPVRYVNPYGA